MNANNGVASLQIVDGGLNNISNIIDRLRTLATESASSTFSGDRSTLNTEYQGLLLEINRQAANVNLNTGGKYNTDLITYVGGGSSQSGAAAAQANAQVTVNLGGANNAVDTTGLGIAATSIAGGGTELSGNTVRLDDTAVTFLAGAHQDFSFHIATATGNTDVTITANALNAAAGETGAGVINDLNKSLATYGISASIANDGTLQFGGSTAFTVTTTGAASGAVANTSSTGTAVNTSNYVANSVAFAAFAGGLGVANSEALVVQNALGSTTITLDGSNADTIDNALAQINTKLNGTGIYAVKTANGSNISFQSANSFNINDLGNTNGSTPAGELFVAGAAAPVGASVTVNKPTAGATNTGNALQALTLLASAVSNLGLVQGTVGAGINKLNYAVNLAQSQVTNYSAAQSGIRDADVAAEAASLTKAQVLQQASLAALAQANSAPQAVLSLLKG